MTQISHKLRALAVQLALTRAQKNHVDKLGALAAEVETLERALQQRRAQDRSMGDSSGKISDNDGHSLRKREESMDGESPTQQTDLAEQYVNICAVCATAFGRPTKREVICPACNPAQQAQPDKSVGILPCPCCGYRAELEQVPHDPQELNAGAYYIECKRAGCGLTTRLAFSCKEDAVPGPVSSWNRRPDQQAQPVAWRKDLNPPHGNWTLIWQAANPWPGQFHVSALYAAPPQPAPEPVAWQLLEDLNLAQLERMAVEKEASGEQRIPCFISVEWVQRAVAAWRNATPQPAQADEAMRLLRDAESKLHPHSVTAERIRAYLARTGGKEE